MKKQSYFTEVGWLIPVSGLVILLWCLEKRSIYRGIIGGFVFLGFMVAGLALLSFVIGSLYSSFKGPYWLSFICSALVVGLGVFMLSSGGHPEQMATLLGLAALGLGICALAKTVVVIIRGKRSD